MNTAPSTEQRLNDLWAQANQLLAGCVGIPASIAGLRLRADGNIVEIAVRFEDQEMTGMAFCSSMLASPLTVADAAVRSFYVFRLPKNAEEIFEEKGIGLAYRGVDEGSDEHPKGVMTSVGQFEDIEPRTLEPTIPTNPIKH